MAFPASTLRLAPTLDQVASLMKSVKNFCQEQRTAMIAGDVGADVLLETWSRLYNARVKLLEYASVPGLSEYAQDQYDDTELNISTEFTGVTSAMNAVVNNINTNFPKNAGNYLLAVQFNSGSFVQRQFTNTDTATLQGLLLDVMNSIA